MQSSSDIAELTQTTMYRIIPNFSLSSCLWPCRSTRIRGQGRRAQRRVAGGLCLPVLGGRTGSLARTGHQKTDVKLDMLSKPRESLRRPPLPRAARPRGTSDNPWKVECLLDKITHTHLSCAPNSMRSRVMLTSRTMSEPK